MSEEFTEEYWNNRDDYKDLNDGEPEEEREPLYYGEADAEFYGLGSENLY